MNEAETRAEHIDPALAAAGWGVVEGSRIRREYAYFGGPVYVYSLKEGINDGFLTPFRAKQISTTLDEYVYTPDDTLVDGEAETGKRYTETDFSKIIQIKEREAHRVKIFMGETNQNE